MVLVPPPFQVEKMQTPGAAISTSGPKLLKLARVSSSSLRQVGDPCPPPCHRLRALEHYPRIKRAPARSGLTQLLLQMVVPVVATAEHSPAQAPPLAVYMLRRRVDDNVRPVL